MQSIDSIVDKGFSWSLDLLVTATIILEINISSNIWRKSSLDVCA